MLLSRSPTIRRYFSLLSTPDHFSILRVSRSRQTARAVRHDLIGRSGTAWICSADLLVDLEGVFQQFAFRGDQPHDRNQPIVEPQLARAVAESGTCMRLSSS